jgi:transcriptional regulator with XRE-family HTH domain
MLTLATPSESALALAKRLRERRLERGWSQEEIAERAGISAGTYVLFERTGKISLVRLIKLLEVLGLMSQIDQVAAADSFASKTLDEITAPKRQRGRRRTQP